MSGTSRTHPWDKRDPSLGKLRSSSGQARRLLFNCTVNSPFCSVCPWDRWGQFSRERHQKDIHDNFMCLVLIAFSLPTRHCETPGLETPDFEVRKGAERKVPEFSKFRPEFFSEFCSEFSSHFSRIFLRFVSWETETTQNSPKIPAIFQCQILRQSEREKNHKSFLESGQANRFS